MHRLRCLLSRVLPGLTLIAALAGGAEASASDPAAITGRWLSSKEAVVIELYPCDKQLCGEIVWLAKPYRKNGEFKRDKRNPDPSLRARGWCGIEVIRGLKDKGQDDWKDGKFYYPKQGRTYDVDIALKSETEIEIRAYLGIRLLGKSETWTRVAPDQEVGCVPEPPVQN